MHQNAALCGNGLKVKAFGDAKFTEHGNIVQFLLEWKEGILGKGENDVNWNFLLSTMCFQKPFTSGLFNFGIVWFYCYLTKQQNFRPFPIERICRRQNGCDSKIEIYFMKGRKHCGKRR